MFDSVFAVVDGTMQISPAGMLASMAAGIAVGIVLSLAYMFRSSHTRSFVATLCMLPAMVAVVIQMVNGNIGAGIAVAGTFSLVRFRSIPGTARDIVFIFLAMCIGLVLGMGYVGYAVLVTAVMVVTSLALSVSGFGSTRDETMELRVTVPEGMSTYGMFDDVLDRYTTSHRLDSMRTTNMGSMYKLTYRVSMADDAERQAMIDEIRTRNGNLEVALTRKEATTNETQQL